MSLKGEYDFIRTRPRESLQLLVLAMCCIWQIAFAILVILFYWLFIRLMRLKGLVVISLGATALIFVSLSNYFYFQGQLTLDEFLRNGFALHFAFWKRYVFNGVGDSLYFLYKTEFNYFIAFGLIVAGILALIDLFFRNPHQNEIEALQNKKHLSGSDISPAKIKDLLDNLRDKDFAGTAIGVSKNSGRYVVIEDKVVNQIVLVLGTTGGGKTITLRRFYNRAITRGYPLIIIDGKPTDENINWVKRLAEKNNKLFYGFNCGNFRHYDPLAHGGYTELKDKVISLKDQWDSDHYRSIAEDYLQTAFEVLIKSGKKFDLKAIAECLNYEELCTLVRETQNQSLAKRVQSLKSYEKKDITGLQAHLHILVHSELGEYFDIDETTFTLADVIDQNGVVYFALPALRFPTFSKVLGKLIMNDLKAVIDHQIKDKKKIFTVFDEYSVFAGEQSLNLVNMGREKGLHSIYGTQGLAELDKVDKTFRQQLMNCVNTLICHRLNDQEGAEAISQWVGTRDAFTVTAQLNTTQCESGMGSVRKNKEFIIHPDAIKQELDTGDVFYITKVGGFKQDRVQVKFT